MKAYLFKEENYNTSRWSGGQTRELAIYPARSRYLDRNFIWRLSSATVETEESDFSKLPDYDRVLMVLDGEVVLSYEGQRVARLKELEQDRFDGAWRTKSFGKITDFNLMVRKGNEGYIDLIYPEPEKKEYTSAFTTKLPMITHALYCKEGYAVVSCGGETHMVSEGQLLVMEYDRDEEVSYSVMGEGIIIRSQIFYGDMQGELFAEEIPAEKASFDDFKCCVYLANVQFRWAKYIVKRLRSQWFDEALSSAIKKVERFYLTTIAFMAGFIGIFALLIYENISNGMALILVALWILTDCLLISPLIYMPFMPKPVRKHIKDVNNLTPYEQRVREGELGSNEHLEKVMKKYKNSGRNLGI